MSDAPRFIAVQRREASRRRRVPRQRAARVAMFAAALEEPSALLEDEGIVHAAEAPLDDAALGSYVRLPQTRSLIVQPPVGATASDVSGLLGEDYIVIEDVELTVPTPAGERKAPAGAVVTPIDQVVPEDALVAAAHRQGIRGKGAVVAVLDTGCSVTHEQFAGKTIAFGEAPEDGIDVVSKPGFDTATHGTHVSGIACGATVGVAPEADLLVVSVISAGLAATATRVWVALSWLLDRIAEPPYTDRSVVMNMSLGFTLADIETKRLGDTLAAIRELLRSCVEDEVLPVIAIGNEGAGKVRAPGYFPEALSVGGVAYDLSEYANSGSGSGPAGFEQDANPDIAGFGVDVLSSLMVDADGKSRYGFKTGTSMAAPYVAGVAALVASKTGAEGGALRDKLLEGALPVPLPSDRVGAGLAGYPKDLL